MHIHDHLSGFRMRKWTGELWKVWLLIKCDLCGRHFGWSCLFVLGGGVCVPACTCACRLHAMAGVIPDHADRSEWRATYVHNLRWAAERLSQVCLMHSHTHTQCTKYIPVPTISSYLQSSHVTSLRSNFIEVQYSRQGFSGHGARQQASRRWCQYNQTVKASSALVLTVVGSLFTWCTDTCMQRLNSFFCLL